MQEHHIFTHLPFKPEELHSMVWDVEKYPQFINLISTIRVRKREDDQLLADVLIRYKFLRETFATTVTRDKHGLDITVKLARGPLRRLDNHWKFHPLEDGSTIVEFFVGYEFSIPMLARFFESKKKKAEHLIMASFAIRAEQLFKPVSLAAMSKEELTMKIEKLEAVSKQA